MKIFQGKIISMKMAKTITVEVERFLAHPIYKKRFKRSKNYQVHSEIDHQIGDLVKFIECPPISKTKRWKLVEANASVKSEILNPKSETISNDKKSKPKTKKKGGTE